MITNYEDKILLFLNQFDNTSRIKINEYLKSLRSIKLVELKNVLNSMFKKRLITMTVNARSFGNSIGGVEQTLDNVPIETSILDEGRKQIDKILSEYKQTQGEKLHAIITFLSRNNNVPDKQFFSSVDIKNLVFCNIINKKETDFLCNILIEENDVLDGSSKDAISIGFHKNTDNVLFNEKYLKNTVDIEANKIENYSIQVNIKEWEKLDRTINEIKKSLKSAVNEEQFQVIGLLSREAMITLAQQIYNEEKHGDDMEISKTDAKKMLDKYLATELNGSSNETIRKYSKATLALTNELTHKRTATKRDAAMCSIAIINLVYLIKTIEDLK